MRRSFRTLDGLRGVAAIVVLIFHAALIHNPASTFVGSAYLAVDLFFLLSGFVIGYAYEDRLTDGLGFRRFLLIRVVRLYPLYILGLAVAVATPFMTAVATRHWWLLTPTVVTLPWSLAMLPKPTADSLQWFMLNPPAWSLFFELVGNILYALLIARLDRRALTIIVAVSGLAITILSLNYGTLGGRPSWEIFFLMCFARMSFAFGLGLLLHRHWRSGTLPSPKLPAGSAIPLLLILIAIPQSTAGSGILTAFTVIVGLPVVVLIGIANEPDPRAAPVMFELGRISYALYVLHWPIIVAMIALAEAIGVSRTAAISLSIPVTLVAAWYASRRFDEPIRAWLSQRMSRSRRSADGTGAWATVPRLPR